MLISEKIYYIICIIQLYMRLIADEKGTALQKRIRANAEQLAKND